MDFEKLPFLRSKMSLLLNPKVRQCTESGVVAVITAWLVLDVK